MYVNNDCWGGNGVYGESGVVCVFCLGIVSVLTSCVTCGAGGVCFELL